MVDVDKVNFAEQLNHFGVIHPNTRVTKELVVAYWADLSGMSRPNFDRACDELRRWSKWYPKPSDFFAAANKGWT